jgi:hypothetical protein
MHNTFKLRPGAQKPFQKVLDPVPVHCNKTVLNTLLEMASPFQQLATFFSPDLFKACLSGLP